MRLALSLLVLFGCSEPKLIEPIVTADRWTVVPLESDPYAEYHAGAAECPAASFGIEDLGGELTLFINVQDCAYLTVEQTALVEVEEEDLMRLRVWHFALYAQEAATATMAMTLDGRSVLDEKIPIPSESQLIAPSPWEAGFEAPRGARVLFHLRNHGSNSYNLIELSRGGELQAR